MPAYRPTDEEMDDMETEDSSTPETESPETNADTFFLPAEFPGSDALKPGDSITLKVVGRDEEGDIEVSAGAGKEMSMSDDLRTSMEA